MLKGEHKDDVSNIHRRWSFTQLTPSSFRTSFAGSIICGIVVVLATHIYYIGSDLSLILVHTVLGAGVLALLHYADHYALRGAPMNKLTKVAHVAMFANIIWVLTALLGIAADAIFSKPVQGLDYLVAGMFLSAGLRMGIYASVFGARLRQAVPVSFIMPVVFLFAIIPATAHPILFSSYLGLGFGVALYVLGVIWVLAADRAGRPLVASTFGLLQAFLSAWTENDSSKVEEYTDARAQDEDLETNVIRFVPEGGGALLGAIVLPDVHPGPFGPVGGSNLPFVLYQKFSKKALVMHSVSDHSLNIPSKVEVERYVEGISSGEKTVRTGDTCTQPSQVKVEKATATGIAFGTTAVVMLSLAPHGMEDVPASVKEEVETHGKELGFSDVLVIDCHNAMGKHLAEEDRTALASAGRKCLEEIAGATQHKFRIGYASSEDGGSISPSELGQAGIAVMAISVGDRKFAIGWADSNNMANELRDRIVAAVGKAGVSMLEVCTSDTHSTSGKRTREGYFAFGTIGDQERITSSFEVVSKKATENAQVPSLFDFARSRSRVRVMGKKQFEDYSNALDNSMSVTKVFLGVTFTTYVAMLFLA